MDRRTFLARAALVSAGVVAADQIEILDRLGWRRRYFPGFTAPPRHHMVVVYPDWEPPHSFIVDAADVDMVRRWAIARYSQSVLSVRELDTGRLVVLGPRLHDLRGSFR